VFNGENTGAAGDCEASVLLSKTAVNGGTTMYTASKPEEFLPALRTAFLSIAGGTASGTAASIVNKRQESGANLLTAVFYPEREFIPTGATTGTKIRWTGDLQNYWYYFDPYFANSGLVEDTTVDNTLNLKTDYRIDLNFSEETRQTTATRFSYDGTTYSKVDDGVPVNSLKALWRAGDLLHAASASDRTIKTNVPGTTTLIDFKDTKKADLRPYLQSPTEDEALKIINYTRGDDTADASYRNRTVTHSGVAKPWKLGDIISSTPKIQSSIQVNNYNRSYNDTSYNQFITSSDYKNRNVVYVGANDGMLHAFSLGKITAKTTEFQKASIAADGSTSPGSELWAYIPGNALPYLRYLTDPNYRHLYTVDLTTTLVDASIAGTDCSGDYWTCDRTTETAVSNWRTLLIGGMGLGGASRPANGTCATSTTIDVNTYADCVKAPINSTGYENVGLSSYFALDVTTPTSPSLKWEFSHADLGYALLEPALVRVGGAKLNGRWFAVFVSGPTGPINTSTSQFYGRSDKTLKLFVVDMATGALARTFDVTASEATIKVDDNLKTAKAFGGPLFTNAIDLDEGKSGSPSYYSTDVVYVSYTRQKKNSSNVYSWDNGSDGGMLRLLTNGSTDPANWTLTSLIDGTGPVTSSMAKMYDDRDPVTQKPVLWLYFGTGRYFYVDQESVDAANEQQYLFGFKEPCYKKDSTGYTVLDKDCAIDLAKGQVVKATHLFDSTYILSLKASDYYTTELSATKDKIGWYALLDPSDSTYNAERVITTPLVRASGVTSFTTFRPTADICGSGGATRMIFRDYRTGGMPAKGSLKGSVVVQLSTGAISKIDLASVLVTGTGSVGSKPPSIELGQGKPPGQAPQDDKPRKPVKKVLHIQEK
jgi:type IV pilus assembly protein PilY1